jgi:hypothetical protein
MTRASGTQAPSNVWRDLYVAALFESDRDSVVPRIAAAEAAIAVRSAELSSASRDTIEEEQDLEDALYALHALRSSLDPGVMAT